MAGTTVPGDVATEHYFGYKRPQNDLGCEDWRSRDQSWDYCRIALEFFPAHQIPFWEMQNADGLIGNPEHTNRRFCMAKPGEVCLVYLPAGGPTELDLTAAGGPFTVRWFNPRTGGPLLEGSVASLTGGSPVAFGHPSADQAEDWLVVVRR